MKIEQAIIISAALIGCSIAVQPIVIYKYRMNECINNYENSSEAEMTDKKREFIKDVCFNTLNK